MLLRKSSTYSSDDPIPAALRPPLNETRKQRALRLKAEAEAKRLSDQIDRELIQEQERLKGNKDVKLLLLGEAESVIQQFQLKYKPHLIEEERISMRAVIYLIVVRALKHILTNLEAWNDTAEDETDDSLELHSRKPGEFLERPSPSTSLLDSGASHIADLRRRLEPLVSVAEPLAHHLHEAQKGRDSQDGVQDIFVQVVAHMLWTLEKGIKELWDDPTVKALILKRRLKLDGRSEFFLEHISRVVNLDYSPTTDDILHARIQTIGVQEHIFDVNIANGKTITWHLYEVGGACGQRHSWVPYFDDINAIIFVVPISDFDQYLEEDPRINKIADSLQLFTQICCNRLLKSIPLILILNKTDLLKAKLDKGVKVRKYVTSFGERSNDYDTVIQYFCAHFSQVHRHNNENGRVLYTHFTDVMDTRVIRHIIGDVRESIFQGYLQAVSDPD